MTNTTPDPEPTPVSERTPSFSEQTDASAPRRRTARYITPVLAAVAVLGVGLFGGVLIGQSTAGASPAGATPMGQARPDGATDGIRPGGGLTTGTVTAVDGDTVTLELSDGSTVTVTTTADTSVTTSEESSVGDLAEGDSLTVVGEADDDGTVAATSISEGAGGFAGGFGGAPGGAPGGGTPPDDADAN